MHEVDVWDVERAYLVWEIEIKRNSLLDGDQNFSLVKRVSFILFLFCLRLRGFKQYYLNSHIVFVTKHMVLYDLHADYLSIFGVPDPAQLGLLCFRIVCGELGFHQVLLWVEGHLPEVGWGLTIGDSRSLLLWQGENIVTIAVDGLTEVKRSQIHISHYFFLFCGIMFFNFGNLRGKYLVI